MAETSISGRFDHAAADTGDVAGKTTIMFGRLDPVHNFLVVDAYENEEWILSRNAIADAIKKYEKGDLQTTVQDEPFWTQVDSRHRLVFRMQMPSWYFPCLRDMQQGKLPFNLISEDPQDDYKRPQIMSERNIWPNSKPDDKRIKTCYVDYTGGWQTIPFVFDLHVNIHQPTKGGGIFKTPIVIDPGSNGGRQTP